MLLVVVEFGADGAKQLGLVDELGTIQQAINYAATKANLKNIA